MSEKCTLASADPIRPFLCYTDHFWILQVSSLRGGDKVFENVLPDETIGPRPVSIFQAPLFLQFRFYHIDYFNLIMFILGSYYYVHELDLQ